MANTYSVRDSNVNKTWFLMITFFLVVIGIGWATSWYFDSPVILVVAVVVAVVMNIASYWFSDKLVLNIAGAIPVTRKEYFDLWNMTENLSITAGLPMPKLYVIPDQVPNAFATGRDKDHSAVAVTTGLLKLLDKTELEGVIAHELAHIQNRDILLQTVVVVLVGFVTLLSDFLLRSTLYGGGGSRDSGGQVKIIGIIVGLALALLAPVIATLIQLAISRRREFLADASGALLTRYPQGLASALEKIGAYSGQMKRANHATAHLFISDPFGTNSKKQLNASAMNKLFATHPPIKDRVSALLGTAPAENR